MARLTPLAAADRALEMLTRSYYDGSTLTVKQRRFIARAEALCTARLAALCPLAEERNR